MFAHSQRMTISPTPQRPDPVATITAQAADRVSALIPIRYSRMAESAFAFYRGGAAVMAADLGPRSHSGLTVQLCGDAHLGNFGIFATSDRGTIFDVNDFDETFPGPFEWDVQRMVTSFAIAAANRPKKHRDRITLAAAAAYRLSLQAFAEISYLDTWYFRVDAHTLRELHSQGALSKSGLNQMNLGFTSARKRDQWSAIRKLTEVVNGKRQFINKPPLVARLGVDDASRERLHAAFASYKASLPEDRRLLVDRYRIVDFGHKVVGVGSVGLLAYIVLLQGRDTDDLLVLQIKQAVASVLEPWVDPLVAVNDAPASHGKRVVVGQRLTQAASDAFLGWIEGGGGKCFYVRQLRDMKWSPDVSNFSTKDFISYAHICGGALARAHARSGDAAAISEFMGSGSDFDDLMLTFAHRYRKQVNADFAQFTSAIAAGDIPIATSEKTIMRVSPTPNGGFELLVA